MQAYSAVVLGSTGNVGRQIVSLLVASPSVSQVVAVNRRQTDDFISLPKVREIVVRDMDTLADAAQTAVRQFGATLGFCAIGVGSGSRKMPLPELHKIEVQYPRAFATGCKAGGVLAMGLLTAAGSDIDSAFTYVRIIGEKEKAVTDVGIPALGIYKPSVIVGNSNTPSYLQHVFPAVQWLLPSRYHAIHKNDLARAMVRGTQQALADLQQKRIRGGALAAPEVKSYEYAAMKPLLD